MADAAIRTLEDEFYEFATIDPRCVATHPLRSSFDELLDCVDFSCGPLRSLEIGRASCRERVLMPV